MHLTDLGSRVLLSNGSVDMILTPPPDPAQAIAGDRFNENRIGLDHVSFSVGGQADLEAAIKQMDKHDVPHGKIVDLAPYQIYILAFHDLDNIQIELTAPYS